MAETLEQTLQRMRAGQTEPPVTAAPGAGRTIPPREETLEQTLQRMRTQTPGGDLDPGALSREMLRQFEGLPEGPDIRAQQDQFLAALVNQGSLGQPGLRDLLARTKIGLTDPVQPTPEDPSGIAEITEQFERDFPKGEIRQYTLPDNLGGGSVLMFRRNPGEPFARFDAPGFGDIAGDIGDISGAAPEIALSGIGALALGPAGALAGLAGVALGGGLGSLGRQEVQKLRGIKTEDQEAILRRSAGAAAMALAGQTLGLAAGSLLRLPTGQGLTAVTPQAMTALSAIQNLPKGEPGFIRSLLGMEGRSMLPPLAAFQTSESPTLQRAGSLAGVRAAPVGRYVAEQLTRARTLLVNWAERESPVDMERLNLQLEKDVRGMQTDLLRDIRGGRVPIAQSGQSAQKAIEDYGFLSKAQVDALYGTARATSGGSLQFNINAANEAAARTIQAMDAGVISRDPALIEAAQRILRHRTGVLADGMPSLGNFLPEEILEGIQGDLWSYLHPTPLPGARNVSLGSGARFAREMFEAIRDSLDTPLGPQATREAFTENWTRARTAARDRFTTQEEIYALIGATQREFAPQQLAETLASGTHPDAVRAVFRALSDQGLADRWDLIQYGLRDDLLKTLTREGSDAVTSRINAIDPGVRDMLLPGDDFNMWQKVIKGWGDVEKIGLQPVIEGRRNLANRVLEIANAGDSNAARNLMALGRRNPELLSAIRRSLLTRFGSYTRTLNIPGPLKGVEALNREKIKREVDALRATYGNDIFTAEDNALLDGLDEYLKFVTPRTGAGESIAATETAGAVSKFSMSGFMDLLHAWGFGTLATTPAGRLLFIGFRPRIHTPQRVLPLMGRLMEQVQEQTEQEKALGLSGEFDYGFDARSLVQ